MAHFTPKGLGPLSVFGELTDPSCRAFTVTDDQPSHFTK